MNKNICAPNKYDNKNCTCFSLEQLIEMAKAYNKYLTKSKLHPNKTQTFGNAGLINIKSDKLYLLTEIKKRFNDICNNDEICITKQSFMNEIVKEMKDDINDNTFRPEGPEKYNEWLSTVDIDNIMYQYENVYPNFRFFGAVPLDCNDLSFCSLYKLDFNELINQGIDNLGVVFNLDRYGESGSHWVALFIDILNGEIFYCDSNGRPPLDNTIIKNFEKFYKNKTGKDATYKYNTQAYQQDNSECGIYSCNFIIRKLAGEEFESIVKNSLGFQEINSCRNSYFRNSPSKYKINPKCDPA